MDFRKHRPLVWLYLYALALLADLLFFLVSWKYSHLEFSWLLGIFLLGGTVVEITRLQQNNILK